MFIHFLSFILFVATFALAEPTGPELVKERMPHYYNAWVEEAGEAAAHTFFKGWTEKEITFLQDKQRRLLDATNPQSPWIMSAERLHMKYASDCFGASGEAYGNVIMRDTAAQIAGGTYMDEDEYKKFNPDGNKPDGLIYKFSGTNLVIENLMESKLGANGWDRSQAEGYLNKWKTDGLTVQTPNGPQKFLPRSISFQIGGEMKNILQVGVDQIKPLTVLVGSVPARGFPGRYEVIPVDATKVREVNEKYIRLLHGGRAAPRGAKDLPAPTYEGTDLEEYRAALRDYLLERGTWPKSGTIGLGPEIARNINRRGGQGFAFIHDLDGATRYYLARHGSLPAPFPLGNQIRRGSPADPNVISALRTYLYKYEKKPYGESSEFVASLAAYSPEWKKFFEEHNVDEFRGADLNELNECLDRLLRIQRGSLNQASES